MNCDAAITVAFSGNRTLTAPAAFGGEDLREAICAALSSLVTDLYNEGKRIFLSGGAMGFDMLAAEQVLRLGESLHDIRLVLVTPFEAQAEGYSPLEKERYASIVARSAEVICLSDEYSLGAFHIRNNYLVENSSHIIAYSNAHGRGTPSTLKKASRRGVEVTNIFDILGGRAVERQLSLDL